MSGMTRFGRILLLILILTGCHKHMPATALPPPVPLPDTVPSTPFPPPLTFPRSEPPPVLVADPLDSADRAFDTGNYTDAAKRYENYLKAEPNGDRRDLALFRQAVSLALLANTNADWSRVFSLLNDFVARHPDSPYRPSAGAILALSGVIQTRDQKIKQLTTELDKLKQTDAERRKRP